MDEDEFLIEVSERFDVYDLVEILGLTSTEICESFRELILSKGYDIFESFR